VKREMASVALLVSLLLAGEVAHGQDRSEAPARVPGTLDEMIALALRSNPEVLVAEARLRQAQAELNQARLKLTQQVVDLYNQKQIKNIELESSKQSLEFARKRVSTGHGSQEEQVKAELARAQAELALTSWEAQARYLLGIGGKLRLGEERDQVRGEEPRKPHLVPRPAMPESFQKALERPVQMEAREVTLKELAKFLQKFTEIPFLVDLENVDDMVEIQLTFEKALPLKSALVALFDQRPDLCIVARGYGFFVTNAGRARGIQGATIPPDIPLEAPETEGN